MKKYSIIYCDPPWSYENKKTGGSHKSGAASKYRVQTTKNLIDIKPPCKKDAILFLWVTVPHLESGIDLMNSWGFKYKTTIIWDKERFGMGFWFRIQTEFLLIGIKGNIKPFRAQIRNIHAEKSLKHSRKPAYFRKIIEMLGYNDKLEMYARSGNREGWDLFGNQAENSIDIQ